MDCPDWRLTQEWISVEVPWKAEFKHKFSIVLRKESPIVVVLSQLDNRYFNGLQGQYSFRLQFRLHEVGCPSEEDYIVQSHDNYLMERSVVAELKSLQAGTYSVNVLVVADRDISASSVEDIVEAQCRNKTDNDKLAQVGIQYDVAHSKGSHHFKSQEAVRKAVEKSKARESRIASRRKNWEKRHLAREIVRKQAKKNRAKRERNEAKDEDDEKEEEKRLTGKSVQRDNAEKEDKAVQTDDRLAHKPHQADQLGILRMNENDKAVQVEIKDYCSSTTSGTPLTPKSSIASPPINKVRGVSLPVSLPPPPLGIPPNQGKISTSSHPQFNQKCARQHITSDGESSASPISDIDDLYDSDDDQASKTKQMNAGESPKQKKGNADEDNYEPWNAVCIVGLRVYSQDTGLEVKVVLHGGEEDEDMPTKNLDKIADDAGTEADDEDGEEEKENLGMIIENPKNDESKEERDLHHEPQSVEAALRIRGGTDNELDNTGRNQKAICGGALAIHIPVPKTTANETAGDYVGAIQRLTI
jgi:hypothetical protein